MPTGPADAPTCPRCGIVFSRGSLVCPGCDVRLVFAGETDGAGTEDGAERVELRRAGAAWIHRLQQELAREGIDHRTRLTGDREAPLAVHVRPEDLPRARRVDRRLYTSEVPDGERATDLESLDPAACPGCGGTVAEADVECPGCGLRLAPDPPGREA